MNNHPVCLLPMAAPSVRGAIAAGSAPQPSILVIDTDFRRRDDLSSLLAGKGFAVQTARNGEEALASIARGGVILAVSSVVMPRMDGLELLRVMRDRHPLIPVIVIASGNRAIDQVYLRGADLLGAARSFTWPLMEFAFLECADSLLEQAS